MEQNSFFVWNTSGLVFTIILLILNVIKTKAAVKNYALGYTENPHPIGPLLGVLFCMIMIFILNGIIAGIVSIVLVWILTNVILQFID